MYGWEKENELLKLTSDEINKIAEKVQNYGEGTEYSDITFALNALFHYVDSSVIENIFLSNSIFGVFIGSLIGLIPNCGASIMLTELYINGVISLGMAMAGLLTGSGVAILVLFKTNKNMKEESLWKNYIPHKQVFLWSCLRMFKNLF